MPATPTEWNDLPLDTKLRLMLWRRALEPAAAATCSLSLVLLFAGGSPVTATILLAVTVFGTLYIGRLTVGQPRMSTPITIVIFALGVALWGWFAAQNHLTPLAWLVTAAPLVAWAAARITAAAATPHGTRGTPPRRQD